MKLKVSNRLGLPQAIVHAVDNDPYHAGKGTDYTITGLLKPARMAQLSKDAEVVEDAADRIYALQGQIMHSILERAGLALRRDGFIVERRFYKKYEVDGKVFTVAAQVDLFDPKAFVLSDYKYTSVGAAKHGLKEDHRLQLNVQAELLRSGYFLDAEDKPVTPRFRVDQAEVVLLLRDWSKERSYEGYPESPALKQVVQFMSPEAVDAWIVERIRAHEKAKTELPLCTQEERWNRPTFAVMKDANAKRATRVFETREEAEAHVSRQTPGSIVVERPGVDVRCLRYCPVRSICSQSAHLQPPPAEPVEEGMVKVS